MRRQVVGAGRRAVTSAESGRRGKNRIPKLKRICRSTIIIAITRREPEQGVDAHRRAFAFRRRICLMLFASCSFMLSNAKHLSSACQPCKDFGSPANQSGEPRTSNKEVYAASEATPSQGPRAQGPQATPQASGQCLAGVQGRNSQLAPAEIEPCFNLAVQNLRKRDFHAASTVLEAILLTKPSFAEAHEVLGVAKENLGDLNGAIQEFRTSLDLNPKSVATLYELADALIQQHQYDAATFFIEQALALSPTADQAFHLQLARARVYDETEQPSEAIKLLRTLVAQHPDSPDAEFYLANSYAHAKVYREASAAYAKCIALDPENDIARLSLAKALILGGEFEAAVEPTKEFIRRHPDDYEGYLVEGRALKWMSKFPEAAEALQRAAQLQPNNYDVRYNLGLVLARLGKAEEAVRELRAAERLGPQMPEPRFELSRLLAGAGDNTQSQQELDMFRSLQVAKERKERAQLLVARGSELLQHGDSEGALKAYLTALEQDPSSALIHYDVSLAEGKLGRRSAQQRELERAVELDPRLAVAHNQLGLLLSGQGQLNKAENEFREALRSNPKFAEAQNNLGVLCGRQGDTSQAIQLFREAATNDPAYPDPHINLGLALAGRGKLKEAEQELIVATHLAPRRVDAFLHLATVQARLGKISEAAQACENVIRLEPDSASARRCSNGL